MGGRGLVLGRLVGLLGKRWSGEIMGFVGSSSV